MANKYGNAVRGSIVRWKFQGLYKPLGISPRYRNTSSASRRGMRTPCTNNIPANLHASLRASGFGFVRSTKKETDTTKGCLSLFLVTRTGIEPMFSAWEADVLTAWPTSRDIFAQLLYTFSRCLSSGFRKVFKLFLKSVLCTWINAVFRQLAGYGMQWKNGLSGLLLRRVFCAVRDVKADEREKNSRKNKFF